MLLMGPPPLLLVFVVPLGFTSVDTLVVVVWPTGETRDHHDDDEDDETDILIFHSFFVVVLIFPPRLVATTNNHVILARFSVSFEFKGARRNAHTLEISIVSLFDHFGRELLTLFLNWVDDETKSIQTTKEVLDLLGYRNYLVRMDF